MDVGSGSGVSVAKPIWQGIEVGSAEGGDGGVAEMSGGGAGVAVSGGIGDSQPTWHGVNVGKGVEVEPGGG